MARSAFWRPHNCQVTRLVHSCPRHVSVSAFLNFGADGATRDHDMGVTHDPGLKSCLIMVSRNTEPSSVVCWSRLGGSGPLAVSVWAVVFSSCHNNHEQEQSRTGGVFDPVRGTPYRNVPKRGKIVPKRGTSQTLKRRRGIPSRKHSKKGYLVTPHFWSLSFTRNKLDIVFYLNSARLGGAQGAR